MKTLETTARRNQTNTAHQTLPIVLALLLGIGLVAMIGFGGGDVLHDVAHDVRHANGFPCH